MYWKNNKNQWTLVHYFGVWNWIFNISFASFAALQSAWCIVFICCVWFTWIQHKKFISTTASTTTSRNSNAKFFITKTAYLSVELNAHYLLYIIILVKEKKLLKEALNIYLFIYLTLSHVNRCFATPAVPEWYIFNSH